MKRKKFFLIIAIFSIFTSGFFKQGFYAFSLDYTEITNSLANSFFDYATDNEGTTSFRSLLIPMGGRAESLGSSYTGLANDVSFIDYNPAASSTLAQTELAVFHNSWIADSALESIAFAHRFGDLGIASKVTCFYVPFSEYNAAGQKVTGSYYSETTGVLNFSYNFMSGYTFKGLAVGANLKGAWRSVPDYADDNTGLIIQNSGLEQSALGIMADLGLLLQFNLAKFYISRDPNFKIGFAISNLGIALTGFSSDSGVKLDDGLPATVGIGFSYRFVKPITLTLDFKQPFNLQNLSEYQFFYAGCGAEIQFTEFFAFLLGFQFKGANPRFSIGSEFEIHKTRININYTLDLTSSLNPINRISLSAKLLLGDQGRKLKQDKIDLLYNEGLYYFSQQNFDKAIEVWSQILELNKYFDPAITGIKSAQKYKQMLEDYTL